MTGSHPLFVLFDIEIWREIVTVFINPISSSDYSICLIAYVTKCIMANWKINIVSLLALSACMI